MNKNKNSKSPIDNPAFRAIVILVTAVLLIYLLPQKVKSLEQYYYASQIVAAIFIAVTGLAALWQYNIASKNNRITFEDLRVQRAIDLSAFYKDSILRYYPAIVYVFDRCGLKKIMDDIPASKMVSFDAEELKQLLTPKQIETFKNTPTKKEFFAAMIEADDIYHLGLDIEKEVESPKGDDGKSRIKITVNTQRVIIAFLANIRDEILNNLEYFSMAFTHNTADESVVYQSLHQSYFEVIHTLYYFIANGNISSTDKYYTNVIKLYKTWKKRNLEQEKKRKVLSNINIHNGTVVD